ncbi:hypothetical protein PhCBS80983_g03110 [Powellomyces hirtus]|uniref:NodB homology domain-containing protein n=1 Tax=Powellomyces hirtus TaxID=109895 RepID=A0A507E572_9FUNG|nr:hypothetical protein PhCBS80983_g03110 [Powellomyces hirtus]
MIPTFIATTLLMAASIKAVHAALTMPPPIPTTWPANDQTQMITGALLTAPLVADALAHVQATVPAALLNIPPSTFISGSTVTYTASAAANCYWPAGQCTRNAAVAGSYEADIVTCPAANVWGVTYDDGPTNNAAHVADTQAIRTVLDSMNAKATFFVCGTSAQSNPAQVLASYNAGHQIASHTWTHHPLTSLSNAQVVAELKYTEAAIYQITGKVPTHFRPPYGDIDDRIRAIASALGYRNVLWVPSRDTQDASVAPSAAGSASALATVRTWFVAQPGFISLQHDISTFTSQLAVDILNAIKATPNFPLTLQSVAQCMNVPAYYGDAGTTGSTSRAVPTSTATSATVVGTSTARATTTPAGEAATARPAGTTTTTLTKPASTAKPTDIPIESSGQSLYSYVSSLVVAAIVALGLPLV